MKSLENERRTMPTSDPHERIYDVLLFVFQILQERLPLQAVDCRLNCPLGENATAASLAPAEEPLSLLPSAAIDAREDELMTVKQAYLEMNVSRSTIYVLRKLGRLTSLYSKKNVRLLRSEVEEAKKWYSQMKGKI